MASRKIKHVAFTYTIDSKDPISGDDIVVFRTALRNETVDVLKQADIDKGEKFGAFYSDEELKAQKDQEPAAVLQRELEGEEEAELDMDSASLEELEEYIIEQEPTVDQVVALAAGDPDRAKRLLAAENAATGNDPRKGVVEGLNRIINRG